MTLCVYTVLYNIVMVDLVQLRTQGRLSALPLNVSFEPVKQKKKEKKQAAGVSVT